MLNLALTTGRVVRARRDHYLPATAPDAVLRAVRVGGRLTCLSLLTLLNVFVLETSHLHVHMTRGSSRMRSPHDRRRRLEPRVSRGVRLHWGPLIEAVGQRACVSVLDAIAHAVLCQAPRATVATLDSALHKGLVTMVELRDLFERLPQRFRVLLSLVDARAESGPESLMRLMLRGLGCAVELQVQFEGVGRVDLVVDGWLVIECDSEEYHSDWARQVADRNRDLQLAARGYCTIRPTANAIMWHPEVVLAAVRGLLEARAAAN
jgi:very-short-patch-repair endonuclease